MYRFEVLQIFGPTLVSSNGNTHTHKRSDCYNPLPMFGYNEMDFSLKNGVHCFEKLSILSDCFALQQLVGSDVFKIAGVLQL